jgi:hypothetical protein
MKKRSVARFIGITCEWLEAGDPYVILFSPAIPVVATETLRLTRQRRTMDGAGVRRQPTRAFGVGGTFPGSPEGARRRILGDRVSHLRIF